MLSPGDILLGTKQVAAAGVTEFAAVDITGALAVTVLAKVNYVSGGATIALLVQTSLDDGVTWIDVVSFAFTTASGLKVANLNGQASKAVASIGGLTGDGINDGVLGSKMRLVGTTTGTYAGATSYEVRINAR